MVDYRGPEFASEFVETWDVQMFNRISEIHFNSIHDPKTMLEKKDLSKLDHLERLSVTNVWSKSEIDDTVHEVTASIPRCRIGDAKKVQGGVELTILSRSFSCSN